MDNDRPHKHRWLGLWLLACGSVAFAAGPAEVRKQVELSMLVTGSVDIEEDGSVSGHILDQPEKLPEAVADLVNRAAPLWNFEPVLQAGKPVKARARMSVRIVAKKVDGGNYAVRIGGATFGGRPGPGESATVQTFQAPRYPIDALRTGVGGTVYLVIQVGRDGSVRDLVAEQVNLSVVASESGMKRWRRLLSDATTVAARTWRFSPPTKGPEAGRETWSVRMPVSFAVGSPPKEEYGRWQAYVPGPRQVVPWVEDGNQSSSPDALADGDVIAVGQGPRLRTPLDQG